MFDKEYYFRGQHADRMIALTSSFSEGLSKGIFDRNIDVYLVAPIVGFLYNKKGEPSSGTERVINHTQLIYEQSNLMFNYRLIMLLDKTHEPDQEERINKAFRHYGTDEAADDEALYEMYVRGGIDVLYEKIVEPSKGADDYLNNLYDFLEDFNDRYNKAISTEEIVDLCKLARN